MADRPRPAPPDHIGWDLVRAARTWETAFTFRMVAAGHTWFGEARGRLLQYIPRTGIAQSTIVSRAKLTKQAVQQHLEALEKDGILRREPMPADQRQRRVVPTETGLAAMDDADQIKQQIEAELGVLLGDAPLRILRQLLSDVATYSQDT